MRAGANEEMNKLRSALRDYLKILGKRDRKCEFE
jgi:hypothetical protein